MPALDALKAFWVLSVFLLIFGWLPAYFFWHRLDSPRAIRVAGGFARTALCVTILVFLLSSLRALGAIAAVLLLLGAIAVGWFQKCAGTPHRLLANLQATTINIVREVESRSFGRLLLPRKPSPSWLRSPASPRVNSWLTGFKRKELLAACFVVVLGMSIVLRTEHAARELRFDQPEQYSTLLRARELMLNTHTSGRPFIFPAMIAATSLLSSTDPAQVTRFLTPAIGLFVVLAAGSLIQICVRANVASLATIYCLGAAALPPVTNQQGVATSTMEKIKSIFNSSLAANGDRPEFALGLLFLLLALIFLADWYRNSRNRDSLLDFACCVVQIAIVSQTLLIVLAISAAALLLRPTAGLMAFAMVCYGLTAYATVSISVTNRAEIGVLLPVAAAIVVGCCVGFIEHWLVARTGPRAETLLLAACVSVAVIWLPPQRFPRRYLEYEAAARATQEIASKFPRQAWVVAAPVEQLAETFGLGGYEDLAGFVQKYRNQISSREFGFQDTREHLFIYVEKTPFQIFSSEPETVSFSVLTDATYRNYRSPGGRASLEAAALQLCETYRQYHTDADVFFENEVLRIYHIHRQQVFETHAGVSAP